ncbi:MAG: autotransporter-associated beta strand repeat-containing protein [Kiritimatiellae bacterium]|nr:autotransporter-associated beta strand repeat-containing protein [Kiritimatiellia bacterium]
MRQTNTLLSAVMIAGIAVQMYAEIEYTWKGSADTNFTNSANWAAGNGPAPAGGTYPSSRISVYNGANHPLYYTAAQGHTIYQNSGRALFVGNNYARPGCMYITGGTFETQSSSDCGLANDSDGTLVIDGGNYIQVAANLTFLVKFSGGGTGTLTVSNGLFETGTLKFGDTGGNYSGSGVINLDGGTTRVSRFFASPGLTTGSAVVNFNGGILEARTSVADFLQRFTQANVLAGGAILNTRENNITVNQSLLDGGGNGGVRKRGDGFLTLGGTNSFTGETVVEAGTLIAANDLALGAAASATIVSNGASLALSGNITVAGEPLLLFGPGMPNYKGCLYAVSGDNAWNGNVLLGSNNTRFSADSGSTLRIGGVINDGGLNYSAEFRGFGSGVMVVSGENIYGGATKVIVATLQLDGGNNRLPIGTSLFLGNDTNTGYATFDLNGFDQEVAGLVYRGTTMTNSVIDSAGGGTLTVNDNGNRTFAGNFAGPLTLVKTNSNALTLNGDLQATSIAVNQGSLQGSATWHGLFNGSDTPNQMIVSGGTLDISSMTFDFDQESKIRPGTYRLIDYSAGGSLLANPSAPFFAASVDMPERSSIVHDTVAKQLLLTYGMEGTVILIH